MKTSNKMGLCKEYLPLKYSTQNVIGTKLKIFQLHISCKSDHMLKDYKEKWL